MSPPFDPDALVAYGSGSFARSRPTPKGSDERRIKRELSSQPVRRRLRARLPSLRQARAYRALMAAMRRLRAFPVQARAFLDSDQSSASAGRGSRLPGVATRDQRLARAGGEDAQSSLAGPRSRFRRPP